MKVVSPAASFDFVILAATRTKSRLKLASYQIGVQPKLAGDPFALQRRSIVLIAVKLRRATYPEPGFGRYPDLAVKFNFCFEEDW